MKIFKITLPYLALAAIIFSASCSRSSVAAGSAVVRGDALYGKYCTPCHGTDGKLGVKDASNLAESFLSVEEAANMISNGDYKMPSFTNKLTSEEIDAVARYVMTLRK